MMRSRVATGGSTRGALHYGGPREIRLKEPQCSASQRSHASPSSKKSRVLPSHTNPHLTRSIVETMGLGELKNPVMRRFLDDICNDEQPLTPFYEDALRHAEKYFPECREAFLGLLRSEAFSDQQWEFLINFMTIVDQLTQVSADDNCFARELWDHLEETKKSLGYRPYNDFDTFMMTLKHTGDFFKAIKVLSLVNVPLPGWLDKTTATYPSKERIEELYKKRKLSLLQRNGLLRLHSQPDQTNANSLGLNIREAGWEALNRGDETSALVAAILIKCLPKGPVFHLTKERATAADPSHYQQPPGGTPGYKATLPPGWIKTYHIWNLGFVLNLDDPEIFTAALLSPCVRQPDAHYFRKRSIVLLLTTYMKTFGMARGRCESQISNIGWEREQLNDVALTYAKEMAAGLGYDSNDLEKIKAGLQNNLSGRSLIKHGLRVSRGG